MNKALISLAITMFSVLFTQPIFADDDCSTAQCELNKLNISDDLTKFSNNVSKGNDSDPCQIVICMMGLVSNANPGECAGAVANYFSIIKFRKGRPDLGATISARMKLTQGCHKAPGFILNTISDTYGAVIR